MTDYDYEVADPRQYTTIGIAGLRVRLRVDNGTLSVDAAMTDKPDEQLLRLGPDGSAEAELSSGREIAKVRLPRPVRAYDREEMRRRRRQLVKDVRTTREGARAFLEVSAKDVREYLKGLKARKTLLLYALTGAARAGVPQADATLVLDGLDTAGIDVRGLVDSAYRSAAS